MKAIILFLFFSFLSLHDKTIAQVTFQKSFITGSNGAPSVKQTNDGGYIITGDNLIRTDENGDTLWSRNFYFGTSSSAQQTFDGGYAIAGYTYNFGAGNTDYYLTRTDSTGNILWSKAYGSPSYDEAYAMQQTSDSGFIIAGNTFGLGSGAWDIYVIRTDANGNTLWTKVIGGGGEEKAASIQQTYDGGFIVAGYTTSFGSAGPDAFVIKTDANGNITWSKTYNGPGGEFISSIRQTNDTGYIFTGHAVNFLTTGQDLFLIKTDVAGSILWSRFFTSSYNFGNSVEQTSDGGYIIAGNSFVSTVNGQDLSLIKTSGNGDTLWTSAFGGTGIDAGTSIQQTEDGGYIVAGKTTSFGTGFYLLKTDSIGNAACNRQHLSLAINDSAVSELSVTSTVSSGGSVTPFTAIAGNGITLNDICFAGINDQVTDNLIQIFPNPSYGSFTLISENKIKKGSVKVFNALSNDILYEEIVNVSSVKITLGNIPSGIYFVKIFDGEKFTCKKLIITKN